MESLIDALYEKIEILQALVESQEGLIETLEAQQAEQFQAIVTPSSN